MGMKKILGSNEDFSRYVKLQLTAAGSILRLLLKESEETRTTVTVMDISLANSDCDVCVYVGYAVCILIYVYMNVPCKS